MIAIDDLRPEGSAYGHTHMHTPNMQALANRSMVFTRAYVQVALCMPSRNALLFSRRPDTAQAWEIASTQFPRICGGVCPGNVCGPSCGIRNSSGALAITLPGWFYTNGWYVNGLNKYPKLYFTHLRSLHYCFFVMHHFLSLCESRKCCRTGALPALLLCIHSVIEFFVTHIYSESKTSIDRHPGTADGSPLNVFFYYY